MRRRFESILVANLEDKFSRDRAQLSCIRFVIRLQSRSHEFAPQPGHIIFVEISREIIWAASWQNQQNSMCAQWRLWSAWASAQSDQSSVPGWRKLGSLATHWVHSEDWSDCVDAQADLSLCWLHSQFVGFVMMRLKWIFPGHFFPYCRFKWQLSATYKSLCTLCWLTA